MDCEFGHELIPGSFSTIQVLLKDDDGIPLLDANGDFLHTKLRLPDHRFRLPGNERDPDRPNIPSRWEADERGSRHSEFDPTGMVMVICEHGLELHPEGRPNYPRGGRTWVRGRYATADFQCVMDRGEPRPDDLTTPANVS